MNSHQDQTSSQTPTAARASFGDIAPALATYTDEVLFGDVWERGPACPHVTAAW